MQLYTADGDKKAIFPIIFEDLDFEATEFGPGVKFVISAVNWTMCRPRLDDYNLNISKLIMGLKAKGLKLLIFKTAWRDYSYSFYFLRFGGRK